MRRIVGGIAFGVALGLILFRLLLYCFGLLPSIAGLVIAAVYYFWPSSPEGRFVVCVIPIFAWGITGFLRDGK